MFERLKAMLIKEFIQTFRDPRMRVVLFILPMIQTVIFGYAVNMDVRQIPTAVIDRDNSPQSRELLTVMFASGHFRQVANLDDERQASRMLDSGRIRVAIVINHGLAEKLGRGQTANVQALVDGSDSNTAGVILGYLSRFAEARNIQLLSEQASRSGGPLLPGAVRMESRAWFNPDLASPPFYVPAVIANILYIITMLLSAMAVVREKEIGTIEQVIVTPIRKYEFILGKTLPFVLIGYANVFLISLVGWLVFRVPVRGSLLLLVVATGLFLMSSLGTGLFLSTISQTQQQAKMSAFFIIFIAMLLSGFAFPVENMPEPVQWLTEINPVRWYMEIIRGLYLKGVGLLILWKQVLMLFLIGSVVLGVAVARFRKTVG
ncbi:ABC-2 type transport system permease protein [Trichlorobacter thiogenes]|uniref:Transport permease protein n=1 Tax=Trichlorobacter thiogenes TaxID=115783 RepID=A0A1T4M6F8_9BACT|nr:ABC transporter permease [Trichlorobacter thiogenes]SJZ62573.1 ABC-2 type transport system permease protein [Trichlorobacter thiogenes]